MKILNLSAKEVAESCPMGECIDEMDRAFRMAAEGKFQSPARSRLAAPSGDILVMPSLAQREAAEGSVKVVSVFPGNTAPTPSITAVVVLLDGETGEPRAFMDGRTLTSIRTAAVTGLSCRYLARKDSKSLGMVGSGGQAYNQVKGVSTALPELERVSIFSMDRARSGEVAREVEGGLGLRAEVAEDARRCVSGRDVVVTATTSKTPVLDGADIADGTHVVAIGSYTPKARELDSSLVCRASVFVDSRRAALEEAGDLLIPIAEGRLKESSIRAELSDLVSGRDRGRTRPGEVTIFKSVGLSLEDNAAGWLAYRRAVKAGAGTWTDM